MTSTTSGSRVHLVPFLIGFGALYALLAGLAEVDASGRFGLGILAAVLPATVLVECLLSGVGPAAAVRNLGFGPPRARAMVVAVVPSLLLLSVFPVVAALTGNALSLRADWPWLLLGIFAFHGVAEELVWRGYAFRQLRRGRSFGGAVLASMPLLAATHLPIILNAGLVVGLSAMLVAAVTTLPLSLLFEAGNRTIWAAALMHTGIDSFKLFSVPDEALVLFTLSLSSASLVVPLVAFVFLTPSPNKEQPCPISPMKQTSPSSEPVLPA